MKNMKNVSLLNFHEGNPIFLEIEKLRLHPIKYGFGRRIIQFKEGINEIIDQQIMQLKKLAVQDLDEFRTVMDRNMNFLSAKIDILERIEQKNRSFITGWINSMTFEGNTLNIFKDYRVRILNELYIEFSNISKNEIKADYDKEIGLKPTERLHIFYRFFEKPSAKDKAILANASDEAKILASLFGGKEDVFRTTLSELRKGSGPDINKSKEKLLQRLTIKSN